MTVFLQQRALYIRSQWCHGATAFQAEAFFKLKNVDLLSCFPRFQERCLSHFGTEFAKDSVRRKGYWLSGTKAKVWEVQRVPESECVHARVLQGEPKVGLQLAGLEGAS